MTIKYQCKFCRSLLEDINQPCLNHNCKINIFSSGQTSESLLIRDKIIKVVNTDCRSNKNE